MMLLTTATCWLCLQGQPIHLWDACTGAIRCTYRGYNAVDEVTPAYSLAFTTDGLHIWAGYSKGIKVFDVSRPGRDCRSITTYKRKQEGSLAGGHAWHDAVQLVREFLFFLPLSRWSFIRASCRLAKGRAAVWVRPTCMHHGNDTYSSVHAHHNRMDIPCFACCLLSMYLTSMHGPCCAMYTLSSVCMHAMQALCPAWQRPVMVY